MRVSVFVIGTTALLATAFPVAAPQGGQTAPPAAQQPPPPAAKIRG